MSRINELLAFQLLVVDILKLTPPETYSKKNHIDLLNEIKRKEPKNAGA